MDETLGLAGRRGDSTGLTAADNLLVGEGPETRGLGDGNVCPVEGPGAWMIGRQWWSKLPIPSDTEDPSTHGQGIQTVGNKN